MEKKNPIATRDFFRWIDNYKVENNWCELFNEGFEFYHRQKEKMAFSETPKFHHLPIAFQIGIIFQFMREARWVYSPNSHVDISNINATMEFITEAFLYNDLPF
jgi:hypothetical protein